jgi:hypothetical protein
LNAFVAKLIPHFLELVLVSVTGLRMAIGARRLHALLQFLAEAVFLSVTGGSDRVRRSHLATLRRTVQLGSLCRTVVLG